MVRWEIKVTKHFENKIWKKHNNSIPHSQVYNTPHTSNP